MIGRRSALSAIGGGLVLAAVPAGATTIGSRGAVPTLDTPAGQMRAFMLMRGALDERLVIGTLSGSYWGVVNGATTPLFDVVSATFARYRRLDDGSYRSVTLEQAYFVDRLTGEWLQSFTNPYTGKTVKVPTGGYPPTVAIFGADRSMHVPNGQPGMVLNHRSTPFVIQGDNLMMAEITNALTTPPNGGRTAYFADTVGLQARLSEINRPDAKSVRCVTSYTSVKSWRAWMEMGDHPGETTSFGQGLSGVRLADLPATWLAAARRHRPELLADPTKLLDPIWREG